MKTTVFYDGEKGTARLSMVKEMNCDIDISLLTHSLIFDMDNLRNAILDGLDIDSIDEADELIDNDDVRRGLLLMVAHEIINHPTKY